MPPVPRSLGLTVPCGPCLPSILGALLLTLVVACQGPTATPSPSATPAPTASVDVAAGGISGRVVNTAGEPVPNALVTIETGAFYSTVTAGPDGEFSASGVFGDFVITVEDLEYVGQTRRVSVEPGELVEVEVVLQPLQ